MSQLASLMICAILDNYEATAGEKIIKRIQSIAFRTGTHQPLALERRFFVVAKRLLDVWGLVRCTLYRQLAAQC